MKIRVLRFISQGIPLAIYNIAFIIGLYIVRPSDDTCFLLVIVDFGLTVFTMGVINYLSSIGDDETRGKKDDGSGQ